jgi:hypothetical protein
MQDVSSTRHIHVPKNGFLRRSLNNILTNYVSGKANVMYA